MNSWQSIALGLEGGGRVPGRLCSKLPAEPCNRVLDAMLSARWPRAPSAPGATHDPVVRGLCHPSYLSSQEITPVLTPSASQSPDPVSFSMAPAP